MATKKGNCSMKNHLYEHPHGGFIEYDSESESLLMCPEDGHPIASIHIGPIGLIELGEKLIEIGKKTPA